MKIRVIHRLKLYSMDIGDSLRSFSRGSANRG